MCDYKKKTLIAVFFCFFTAFLFSEERCNEVVKAVSKVLPSVVNIGSERIISSSYSPWGDDPFDSFFREFFGDLGERRTNSLGSGVIIDQAGLILTNSHVVHRAVEINVVFFDGKTAKAVEVASDDFNDIALLALLPPVPPDLKPISICSGELYLGETVIAVGNPYGLGNSISRGILSATNREAIYRGKTIFSDILQTDAAINPGNSGGPLVNILGEMIGLNTAIHREAHGIGFAVPVKRIENVLAAWLIPERFSNTSLGIIPTLGDSRKFFVLSEVFPDSPAAKSGLKAGMKITHINGKKFDNLISLGRELWKIKAGEKILLKDLNGKEWILKAEEFQLTDGRQLALHRLGLSLVELDKDIAGSIDYPISGGLVVTNLKREIPDISRGDVLVRINDTRINNFKDLARALKNLNYGKKVNALFLSLIERGGLVYILKKEVIIELK